MLPGVCVWGGGGFYNALEELAALTISFSELSTRTVAVMSYSETTVRCVTFRKTPTVTKSLDVIHQNVAYPL